LILETSRQRVGGKGRAIIGVLPFFANSFYKISTEIQEKKMNLEERIGVQTLLLAEKGGRTDAEAIASAVKQIGDAGFKAIEIVPAQFTPGEGREAAAFLEKAFGAEERKRLRSLLEPFRMVTVHGSNVIVRIPPARGEKTDDLWRPYLELMRFARDIGAQLVTFHSFQPAKGANPEREEMIGYYTEFGKLAAKHAEEWDLLAGFELATHYKFLVENQVIERIGSPKFGSLFDLGHVALHFAGSADITASVLSVVEECPGHILEFHAGGVQLTSQGLREHRPLDQNNLLDHGKLMQLLERKNYRGPMIFEIFFRSSNPEQSLATFSENLEVCMEAKKQILRG
jgi:sugar phosphate isomerase/epimerase